MEKKYDLEERTLTFSREVLTLCQSMKQDTVTRPLINQLVKSATSIGANYAEANGASSKKDFQNKIFISKKEAQETKYWLRLMSEAYTEYSDVIRPLLNETQELILILGKITKTLKSQQ